MTAPAAATIAAGGKGQVSNPVAVPNQKLDVDPAKTKDLNVTGGKDASSSTEGAVSAESVTAKPAPAPPTEEAPKQDFAIGIKQTDAEKEAEKRAARAKRFGITEDEEEKKKLERAKKFGTDKEVVVKGLDDALPERRAKRGREGEKNAGRAAKRQTPDRRTEAAPAKPATAKAAPAPAKKAAGKITDDPVEKAKAEARAKRFQTTV
jgi:SAP domain-containing ribonucleoprotein